MSPKYPNRSIEVAELYLGLMQALEGASLPALRSALAMTLLMTGERLGLSGEALGDWIDQPGEEAKAILVRPPAPRN